MNAEALATYVLLTRKWLAAGNVPTAAWWESFLNAQAEVLLRATRQTGGLSDRQLDALLTWTARLEQAGMPMTTDERALRINLHEEHQHRFGGGGRDSSNDPAFPDNLTLSGADPEHSVYAQERDRLDAILRAEAEELEEEGLRRTR